MAMEAARQTFVSDQVSRPLQLSEIRFQDGLPLDMLTGPDASVEIQMIAKSSEENSDMYGFEIFSNCISCGDVRSWKLHCSGKYAQQNDTLSATPIITDERSTLAPHNAETANNEHHNRILKNIKTNRHGFTGEFQETLHPSSDYMIDPVVLDAILSLPPAIIAGKNLPATYCVRSISSFTVSSFVKSIEVGQFGIEIDSITPYGIHTAIEITQGQSKAVIKGVLHQASQLRLQEPAMESLYFKSKLLPDITHLESSGSSINFARCVELLTHKWPMCDVKLIDIESSTTLDIVLNAFRIYSKDQRPLVRSIYLHRTPCPQDLNRIQYLDHSSTETESKYHFIVVQKTPNLKTINDELLPRGLVCFTTLDETDQIQLRDYFEHVYKIDAMHGEQWQLWRKKRAKSVIHSNVKRILFGALPSGTSLDALSPFHESVPVEPGMVAAFCHNSQNARFHAIIMDPSDESIIATWSGQVLLPFLQTLLKSADSIFWVTKKNTGSPFQKMVGTLLRTLQAEQPSLKVCWLLWSDKLQKMHNGKAFEEELVMAQETMLEGQNELLLDFAGEGAPHIVRYYPDDELSCSTGIQSPRNVAGSLDHLEYELTFAAPRKPVILSKTINTLHCIGINDLDQDVNQSACHANIVKANPEDLVEVTIQASVIDLDDVKTFDACNERRSTSMQPKIFAGTVNHDPKGCYKPGIPVVGWSNIGHRNRLQVHRSTLYERILQQPAVEAASEFAAITVAVHIIHGAARARKGETFDLRVTGVLHAALITVCKHNGNTVISQDSDQQADFVVSYDTFKGVQVNGQAVDMINSLSSPPCRVEEWYPSAPLSCSWVALGISDYSEAFSEDSKARQEPFSTLIDHTIHYDTIEHVPIYEPQSTLFSSTANYVLIGGLGGLGRFICTWMVEHGARQLTVISRSGLTSAEGQSTHAAITKTGSTLNVFAADACDRPTVRSILSSVRKKGPIKGIINLAMVLGDAPMASMTGEEWDRALRVKIDSSWILHEETMDDELDHFILFSSIASVCGNRNQGNYNVANTFLNALAEYRQGMGRCGVSIALGAMSEFLSPLRCLACTHTI